MAGCAAEDCHAFQGNIRADKLIALDAYAVKGEKCIRQSFSLGECCSLCKATKSCNAWSFCNEPEGCGNTCESAKHAFSWYALPQPWNDVDPEEHPFRLNPSHACTAAGGFPYGTCSLKTLEPEKLAQPTVQQGRWDFLQRPQWALQWFSLQRTGFFNSLALAKIAFKEFMPCKSEGNAEAPEQLSQQQTACMTLACTPTCTHAVLLSAWLSLTGNQTGWISGVVSAGSGEEAGRHSCCTLTAA